MQIRTAMMLGPIREYSNRSILVKFVIFICNKLKHFGLKKMNGDVSAGDWGRGHWVR